MVYLYYANGKQERFPKCKQEKAPYHYLIMNNKKAVSMFTVIKKKKETAWIEVGLEGKVGRKGRFCVQGLAQTPHLPLWGLGFPSHPDPRTVL